MHGWPPPGHVDVGDQIGLDWKRHRARDCVEHVYENLEDGWFCFGCKRHGHSVYDLAGAMWNVDTRGPSFVELRARLYGLFLPAQPPPAPPRAAARPATATPPRPRGSQTR
jgi:hypothetical protein